MSERIRGSYDDALYKSTYTLLLLHEHVLLGVIIKQHQYFVDQKKTESLAREVTFICHFHTVKSHSLSALRLLDGNWSVKRFCFGVFKNKHFY